MKRLLFFLIALLIVGCISTREFEKIVREPVVAGIWYPADAGELDSLVGQYLNNSEKIGQGNVKALIVPHAGYRFSGQAAAYAYNQLEDNYDTLIVLGPSHHYSFLGASILNVTHYKTPLGEIKLSDKAKELLKSEYINTVPQAHSEEHSLEVQLPFLQKTLGDFELIPIVIGNANPNDLAKTLMPYIDSKTLIVASTDMSHYHPYEECVAIDSRCINSITKMDIAEAAKCEMCGDLAVITLMMIAKEKGWVPKLLKYANSGDVTGDKSAVVGYAAIGFYDEETKEVNNEEQEFLLKLARLTLELALKEGKQPVVDESKLTQKLKTVQGCFVTLEKNNLLRGCIGHILPQKQLYQCVIENSVNAALHDSRFSAVEYGELEDIEIEISVLSVPEELKFDSPQDLLNKLSPHVDGVVLKSGAQTSTYLPQVWEQIPDKQEFLANLCAKAGLSTNCWQQPEAKIETYQAQVFKESN